MFLSLLLLFAMTVGCRKSSTSELPGDPNPKISAIPAIELISVSQTQVTQFTDTLGFKITYIDGDGDLGSLDANKHVIELVDTRDERSLIFGFHLSPRIPAGSTLTVQGELTVVLNNTILLDATSSQETTTFKIRLIDEAGNWSNQIETETITILP